MAGGVARGASTAPTDSKLSSSDDDVESPIAVVGVSSSVNIGGEGGAQDAMCELDSSNNSFVGLRRHWPLGQLLMLFACSFSYAFIFNTINNVVIPKEIERLAPSRQSIWVGLIMAAGALSQLVTPIIGAASDRSGLRTTFLIYGSFVVIIGVVLFLATTTFNDMAMLFLAHVMTSIGLSMQYAMVSALLNDHVAEEQVGKGSGTMAILAILGSGAGYVMFAFNLPLYYSYFCYIVAAIVCLLITLYVVPTADVSPKRRAHAPAGNRLCSDVSHALNLPNPRKHTDFFFACLSRAMFNAGLAGQVYLVFYFRDVVHADNPTQLTSVVAVMALLGGVIGALPAGVLSDRVGKKPLIYVSISVCVVALALFMVGTSTLMLHCVGFIYGVGNVAYLSVDYALGVQCLPRKTSGDRKGVPIDAAKDLGVFAMSATVGQLFGQMIYAAVLEQFSIVTPTGFVQYGYYGFVTVYGIGCLAFVLSGVATSYVKSVK